MSAAAKSEAGAGGAEASRSGEFPPALQSVFRRFPALLAERRALIVLLPVLSPLALLAYLRGTGSPAMTQEASASQNAAKTAT